MGLMTRAGLCRNFACCPNHVILSTRTFAVTAAWAAARNSVRAPRKYMVPILRAGEAKTPLNGRMTIQAGLIRVVGYGNPLLLCPFICPSSPFPQTACPLEHDSRPMEAFACRKEAAGCSHSAPIAIDFNEKTIVCSQRSPRLRPRSRPDGSVSPKRNGITRHRPGLSSKTHDSAFPRRFDD